MGLSLKHPLGKNNPVSNTVNKITSNVGSVVNKGTAALKSGITHPIRLVNPMLTIPGRALGVKDKYMDPAEKALTAAEVAAMGGYFMGGAGAGGGAAAGGEAGGAGALASSGGLPLVTKVLLGMDVLSTVAGYFGRKKGPDFDNFYAGLDQQEQAQIDQLKESLTQIQTDIDTRNAAIKDLTDQYPQIMAQNLKEVSATMGPEIDAATKGILANTADQLAAKFQTQGGFSSGAFNEAMAKVTVDTKFPLMYDAATKMFDARYSEAVAGRNFQLQMLGQGKQDIFSANQNYINNLYSEAGTKAKAAVDENNADNKATQDLFGGLGETAGYAAIAMGGRRSPATATPTTPAPKTADPSWAGGDPYGNPYG